MRIPLSRPQLDPSDREAVARVLAGHQLALGPELERFEQRLAERCAASAALAVSSGTAALYLALRALGVGPGDEVITVSYTFVGTVNAIHLCGAQPVLVDVDPHTRNMDPVALEAAIGARTRAVIPVHLFGRAAPMESILAICQPRGIAVVEDACEALGARIGETPVGAMGDCGAFGFYPNKPITTGEGGALVARDAALIERCRALGNQGRARGERQPGLDEPGFNFRMSELNAALGASQLARLDEIMAARAAVAARYHAALDGLDLIRPPLDVPGETLSWFVYVVELAAEVDRDAVMASLAAEGIQTGLYFPALHRLPGQAGRCRSAGTLTHSERLAARCLALPFWPGLTEGQVAEVAAALGRAISRDRDGRRAPGNRL